MPTFLTRWLSVPILSAPVRLRWRRTPTKTTVRGEAVPLSVSPDAAPTKGAPEVMETTGSYPTVWWRRAVEALAIRWSCLTGRCLRVHFRWLARRGRKGVCRAASDPSEAYLKTRKICRHGSRPLISFDVPNLAVHAARTAASERSGDSPWWVASEMFGIDGLLNNGCLW